MRPKDEASRRTARPDGTRLILKRVLGLPDHSLPNESRQASADTLDLVRCSDSSVSVAPRSSRSAHTRSRPSTEHYLIELVIRQCPGSRFVQLMDAHHESPLPRARLFRLKAGSRARLRGA